MDEATHDDHLLERWQHGDFAAFEEVFQTHYAMIHRLLQRVVGNPEDADDLAQEVFLQLYHHPPKVRAGSGVAAWLARVALNRGANLLRASRRALAREQQAAADEPFSPDPQLEVLRAAEQAHVRKILADLPPRQAEILLLRYAGYAYAEIAAIVAVAPSSVGTLLARAERAFERAYHAALPYADAPTLLIDGEP